MPKPVTTQTITSLRDDIYARSEQAGVTAITRRGVFVGVLITPGPLSDAMARQLHRMARNNPVHATTELAKRATG